MSHNSESVVRFFRPPEGSYFLFGPRGTGKSTFLRQAYPEAHRLDLLDPATERFYKTRPERLREWVLAHPGPQTFVVDEVQRAPGVLTVVHAILEEKTGHQFVLTGSSARKLKVSADLLAGRAVRRGFHPFMGAELGAKFDLKRALEVGLLPLIWNAAAPADVLRSYVALYVREEVQLEGLVRKLDQFNRFLEAISFSQAAPINMTSVAQECGVDRKTVENYVGILTDLLLAYRIPVFTKRARREMTQHPKFFFFDAGVFRSLRPKGPLDSPHEIDGPALEGMVAEHLRSWMEYGQVEGELAFWRSRAGVEVDLVVYGSAGFCGIEVKNTSTIRDADLRGLRAFLEDYPEAKGLFLYRGRDKLKKGRVLCWPVEDFLRQLKPGQPIPGLV